MLEYVTAVKRALRDQHKFKPLPRSTRNEPLLEVPDGTYQVTIDGKVDYIRLVDGGMTFLQKRKPRKFITPKVIKNTRIT